jgi:hypothetical protein
MFNYDCGRSTFSGELWVSGFFSHWELILLYFLRVSRVMADVATAKRVALNFLRIVSRHMAYCSRTCVFEGRSVGAYVIGISPCVVLECKAIAAFYSGGEWLTELR